MFAITQNCKPFSYIFNDLIYKAIKLNSNAKYLTINFSTVKIVGYLQNNQLLPFSNIIKFEESGVVILILDSNDPYNFLCKNVSVNFQNFQSLEEINDFKKVENIYKFQGEIGGDNDIFVMYLNDERRFLKYSILFNLFGSNRFVDFIFQYRNESFFTYASDNTSTFFPQYATQNLSSFHRIRFTVNNGFLNGRILLPSNIQSVIISTQLNTIIDSSFKFC